jgi:hypothetical protein
LRRKSAVVPGVFVVNSIPDRRRGEDFEATKFV